ncbi:MAG: DegT/DnrJ/EryC1/StrS family aminotransferase [Candidatus Tritonobacter lacicola]|nr:DegT/DnrJ/EryC1/StrS family aminotransferase [Candidatus Tritonobacter lacicola]
MSSPGTIPFIDFKRQYRLIEGEIRGAIERVFDSGYFILGREVESLEREFASYCGSSFGVGVASGTEALYVSLLACGIEPGDEVVTVANAGVPTIAAITLAGAIPVFVDIDPGSYTIDVSKIEEAITDRTRVLLPVHLYGQCADMAPLLEIAGEHGLKVVEDACQAHGASYGGKRAGSLGDAGCFSFYPTKNLGAYGDAGMIVTGDAGTAERARLLRNYGQVDRYHHRLRGINSRLDEIQAAVLRVKLKYLDAWNIKRIEIAGKYEKHIVNGLITKPGKMEYGTHVFHLYVIACELRDELREYLGKKGIATLIHYPVPVYLQEAYAGLKERTDCPVTESSSRTVLSLPLYPEITDGEVSRICAAVNIFQ